MVIVDKLSHSLHFIRIPTFEIRKKRVPYLHAS
jgi:hypothetical protein